MWNALRNLAWVAVLHTPILVEAAPLGAPRHDGFLLNGEPISPVIIGDFLGWMSDSGPTLRTVDLTEATGSNRYHDDGITGSLESGFLIAQVGVEDGRVPPSFGYRVLGVLSNGDFVRQAFQSGGGSGVFFDLLVVRMHDVASVDLRHAPEQHTALTLVATLVLGDRDTGELVLEGDVIWIGASQHRDAERRFDLVARETR